MTLPFTLCIFFIFKFVSAMPWFIKALEHMLNFKYLTAAKTNCILSLWWLKVIKKSLAFPNKYFSILIACKPDPTAPAEVGVGLCAWLEGELPEISLLNSGTAPRYPGHSMSRRVGSGWTWVWPVTKHWEEHVAALILLAVAGWEMPDVPQLPGHICEAFSISSTGISHTGEP